MTAWLYVQWATSKAMFPKWLHVGAGPAADPKRASDAFRPVLAKDA